MTQPDLFINEADKRRIDAAQARRRKREGRSRVACHNDAFIAACRDYAKRHAIVHGSVTIEDVRRWAEENGIEPRHRNAWGAILGGKQWRIIDYVTNRIPSTHARRIAVWAYVQPSGVTP